MIRVAKDKKRTMKSLGISVNPKHWDFVKNKPKPSCPNKEQIQRIILAIHNGRPLDDKFTT